jgi:hypothetical protein
VLLISFSRRRLTRNVFRLLRHGPRRRSYGRSWFYERQAAGAFKHLETTLVPGERLLMPPVVAGPFAASPLTARVNGLPRPL